MNNLLWIIQIMLAFAFFVSGLRKLLVPYEQQHATKTWVQDFSPNALRLIAWLEILGAVGLLLPGITGLFTWLTPLAAVGLVLTMIGAMLTHLRRHENGEIAINVILMGLALVIVYGRFIAVPL